MTKRLENPGKRGRKRLRPLSRNCLNCKREYEPDRIAQKYCGPECSKVATRLPRKPRGKKPPQTKPCERCGKPFELKHNGAKSFCSRKCSVNTIWEARPKVVKERRIIPDRECRECKATFRPSQIKSVYCSPRCCVASSIKKQSEKRKSERTLYKFNCLECGDESSSYSTLSKYCSKECATRSVKRRGRHTRRARMKEADNERVDMIYLINKSSGLCGICGDRLDMTLSFPDPLSYSVDHIIPLAKGGSHTHDNLQLAHFICNSKKSDTLPGALR